MQPGLRGDTASHSKRFRKSTESSGNLIAVVLRVHYTAILAYGKPTGTGVTQLGASFYIINRLSHFSSSSSLHWHIVCLIA